MSDAYNEVGRWNVGTPDGNSEEMILEKNNSRVRASENLITKKPCHGP